MWSFNIMFVYSMRYLCVVCLDGMFHGKPAFLLCLFSLCDLFSACVFRSRTLLYKNIRQPCFAFNHLFLLFTLDWSSLLLYIQFEIASLTSVHCNHDNQCAVCSHISLIKGTAAGMVSARVSLSLRWLFKCFSLNLTVNKEPCVCLLLPEF